MECRLQLHFAVLIHKITRFESSPYLFEKLTFGTYAHNLNVMNKGLLTPPSYSTFFLCDHFATMHLNITIFFKILRIYLYPVSAFRMYLSPGWVVDIMCDYVISVGLFLLFMRITIRNFFLFFSCYTLASGKSVCNLCL